MEVADQPLFWFGRPVAVAGHNTGDARVLFIQPTWQVQGILALVVGSRLEIATFCTFVGHNVRSDYLSEVFHAIIIMISTFIFIVRTAARRPITVVA